MAKPNRGGRRSALLGRTTAQDKEIKRLVKRTANLKNEQYRIIDADGNVLLEKRGAEHAVAATVGEKRQYLSGNVSLHNHPNGGTFSEADLKDFGYGAKEIVVASPEGTYRLINTKYGTKEQYDGWVGLRDKLNASVPEASISGLFKQAQKNLENSKTNRDLRAISNRWASIRETKGRDAADKYLKSVKPKFDALTEKSKKEYRAEYRRLEVQPFHDFYTNNAKEFGFDYRFEKK